MPLIPPLTLYIAWCATMSLMALAYGAYAGSRQARGRPIVGKEWFRNYLILLAVAVNSSSLVLIVWTNLPLPYFLSVLGPIVGFSLAPLLLWYVFALPLRLLRSLTRRRPARGDAPHPLDGAWSPATSFLDEINAQRGHPPGGPDAGATSNRLPSSALDRVARYHPVASPPEGRAR